MDKARCIDSLSADHAALTAAAHRGLEAPVPTCPGWTVAHVVSHVGRAYRWIAEIVGTRARHPVKNLPSAHGFDPLAPGLLPWIEDGFAQFMAAVREADPQEPVWSWSGENRVGFWLRLQTHELAIHRVDAQSAHGAPAPIDADVAADAIEGNLRWFLPLMRPRSFLPGGGQSFRFLSTDGPGDWRVTFDGDELAIDEAGGPAQVTARGSTSDLLLFLWGRLPADGLQVEGDAALLARFHEFAPLP